MYYVYVSYNAIFFQVNLRESLAFPTPHEIAKWNYAHKCNIINPLKGTRVENHVQSLKRRSLADNRHVNPAICVMFSY